MATVRHLIYLLLFLQAIEFLASNAWPVTSKPSLNVTSLGDNAILGGDQQPIGRLTDGSPLSVSSSTPDNSRDASQFFSLVVASNTSSLNQADATVPRQSSSQSNNESPSQQNTKVLNYNRTISNSNSVVEQPLRPNRGIPPIAPTSNQNFSELRPSKTPSLETDRLIEGSGLGPLLGSQRKEAKSKLDDTEESDDDDEDYDETLDTGSGYGNLNSKPSSPSPSNIVVDSASSVLKEPPQLSDFYKPFRPPVHAASPSHVATDNQQKRPNRYLPQTVLSPVAQAPAQVMPLAKNVTASFVVTTPAPPRVPSVIPTLDTPALSRGVTPAAQNRTKLEPDYEDEEESEDEDDGEISAFEDNDTSEADGAAAGAAPRRPAVNTLMKSNSTLYNHSTAMRPLDTVHHLSRPSGFERPFDVSTASSVKPSTLITSPANVPPSLPPTILARPITPPTVRPAPSSVSSMSVDTRVDEEEEEDVEEDEEEEEEEEDDDDDELAKNDMDGDYQYRYNTTRPIISQGVNLPSRVLDVPSKLPTMQTVQDHALRDQTTTTSAPYPSQYNNRPAPLASVQAPTTSSAQPPRWSAPVNHESHYVTTASPTRMPATLTANITPTMSNITVPIVSSKLPQDSTSFVPTVHPPSYKSSPILNGATSVTSTTSHQSQAPILVQTIRGQETAVLVNWPTPSPQPATTTTIAPQDKTKTNFTKLDSRPPPTMQFAATPTNRGVDDVAGQTNRALRDNNHVAADDTLTKQIYDKAVEVYHEVDKTVRAAWEAVWPPNMNFDSASMEPLLTQPLFFMLALGGAIICLVLLMMLVVYIISYQIQPKVDDDISIY